jgi:hypothetical protein
MQDKILVYRKLTTFENAADFKHLGMTAANKNFIHKDVKSILNSRLLSAIQFTSHLVTNNVKTKIYITIILPVVLYGCDTWSLTLPEEHRWRVFENRVLRRIFGPKREEVAGGWRRLHNEELHDLYSSSNIIRVIKSRIIKWA